MNTHEADAPERLPEAIVGSLLSAFGAFVAGVILIASCEFTLWTRRRCLAQ